MTYARDATGPFYHGTRADPKPGALLAPGFASNHAGQALARLEADGRNHIID